MGLTPWLKQQAEFLLYVPCIFMYNLKKKKSLIHSSGGTETFYVGPSWLALRDLPTFDSQELGLEAYPRMLNLTNCSA